MSIERGDFDAVSEQDLLELVEAQVPEGLRNEYKRETYGKSDADKREFLKDVSALANTQGGHLILGIEESEGAAVTILGIGGVDPDVERLRLEQLVRDGLEPRVSGIRMKAIPLETGGHVMLIRVPRSWNAPHRVIAQRYNRFFLRHSAGVHEPNVQELRSLFNESASALERAREFRDDRVEALRKNVHGAGPLQPSGQLIFHIVPIASFSGAAPVDVAHAWSLHKSFAPMNWKSLAPRYNYNGFVVEDCADGKTGALSGYTQVFRNGALESARGNCITLHNDLRIIGATNLEKALFRTFPACLKGLRDLEVPPPFVVMLTLCGVHGVLYHYGSLTSDGPWQPLPEDTLYLPESTIEDYGEEADYQRAMKPAFDALWNAAGHPRSLNFTDDGRWIGNVGKLGQGQH